MLQPLAILEQLQTLLHLFIGFNVVQKIFVVLLFLLLFLLVLLPALSFLDHDPFILEFLQLEGPAVGLFTLC